MGRRGFTLVEMLIAMVIVGIMGIALVGFLRAQHQTMVRQNSGVLATQNARAAMDMLARELRNAGYNPRGALSGAEIRAMDVDSVAWTADMNADGDTLDSSTGLWDERVAYYVQGTSMMRAAAGILDGQPATALAPAARAGSHGPKPQRGHRSCTPERSSPRPGIRPGSRR